MTCITDTNSRRRLSAKLAAGLVISALLVLGTSLASASAEERRDDHRGGDRHGDWHGGGGGGYYPAPPVVYGTPYYTLHRRWFTVPPSAYICRALPSAFSKRLIRRRPSAAMPAAAFAARGQVAALGRRTRHEFDCPQCASTDVAITSDGCASTLALCALWRHASTVSCNDLV